MEIPSYLEGEITCCVNCQCPCECEPCGGTDPVTGGHGMSATASAVNATGTK